jgi:transposase-like protein
MARIKKVHGEAFKAKVALESVRGELTANQIGSRYGVHPTLVNRWRKELIAGAGTIGGHLIPSIDTVPAIKIPGGGRRKRPQAFLADRAYDAEAKIRKAMRQRKIVPYIAKRKTPN